MPQYRFSSSSSTPRLNSVPPTEVADHHECGHSHHGHSHSHGTLEAHVKGKALQDCKRVTIIGLLTNIFFSSTKLLAGSAGGSVALMADGFHALTDIFADLISYMSMSLSRKRFPRCKFPFGIGRLETIGTVIVASILFIGGAILLWDSIWSFVGEWWNPLLLAWTPTPVEDVHQHYHSVAMTSSAHSHKDGYPFSNTSEHTCAPTNGENVHHDHHAHSHCHGGGGVGHSHFTLTTTDEAGVEHIVWLMIALAGSSVICKELLYRLARRVGERAGSRVVVANAYHHRADAWSGAVTLVGLCGQSLGIPGADGLAGLVVSYCICQVGFKLTKEAVLELFDYQRVDEVREVRQRLQRFRLVNSSVHMEKFPVFSHGSDTVKWKDEQRDVRTVSSGMVEKSTSSTPFNIDTSCKCDGTTVPELFSRNDATRTTVRDEGSGNSGTSSHFEGEKERGSITKATDIPTVVCGPKRSLPDHSELRERVRFINIFILRHGHTSAIHVTLLACASLPATEIAKVSEQLPQLASTQLSSTNSTLSVEGAFIKLLICNPDETFLRSSLEVRKEGRDEAQASMEISTESSSASTATIPSPAALGDVVQPSLERCIDALMNFHDFSSPIRYHWEKRVLFIPVGSHSCRHSCEHLQGSISLATGDSQHTHHHHSHSVAGEHEGGRSWSSFISLFSNKSKTDGQKTSDECIQDVVSVAEMFQCRVEFV